MPQTHPFELTADEIRLIRFYRCLPIGRQEPILKRIAEEAVETRLPLDLRTNGFAALMPEPPAIGVRGEIDDGFSVDHWINCALEATGDPEGTLLGGSSWDDEETLPRMVAAFNREADRQGVYYLAEVRGELEELLKTWRSNIVRACESPLDFSNTKTNP